MIRSKSMDRLCKGMSCLAVFALAQFAMAGEAGTTPDASTTWGDQPTPAQTELIQGVQERRHEAAIEKADNEHQAEMKKCEGLVWEEEKLCKDQVSKETAQTQAKAEKDREKTTPSAPETND